MAVDILDVGAPIEFEGKAGELFDAYVSRTIQQNNLLDDHKQYMGMLNYVDTNLLNPDQKFSSRLPNNGLGTITERGLKNKRTFKFGPKKGLPQVEYGDQFDMSYLATEWAKRGKNLEGAPDGVQAEFVQVANQTRDLMQGYDITYAETMVKVLTNGFGTDDVSARDGLSLFNAAHELEDGSTFSNIVTGATNFSDITDGQAKLQDALDKLKTMKFDNGKKIRQPKGEPYKLFVSRLRETYWLEVINNGSNYAGDGSNAAKENTFRFRNNLVQVVVLDLLGDSDRDGNAIGTDDMWFLMNPTVATQLEAFRSATLYAPRIKTYEDDDTDLYVTSIRAIVGASHFDAEFCIVGSTGAA